MAIRGGEKRATIKVKNELQNGYSKTFLFIIIMNINRLASSIKTNGKAGGMIQEIEHLPNNHKALSSNPSITGVGGGEGGR
jgi:hypothetical protein